MVIMDLRLFQKSVRGYAHPSQSVKACPTPARRHSLLTSRKMNPMLMQWQLRLLTALAALALILAVTDIVMFNGNQAAQNEFSGRTQYIQQSLQLEPIYQGVIRSLAELSAKSNDEQIKNLLNSQGINFTVNPPKGQDHE